MTTSSSPIAMISCHGGCVPARIRIAEFKRALKDSGVQLASLLPMYRWASPHEDERQAAVRYWKEAIQVAVAMGVDTMNSEFGRGPSPDRGHRSNCCGGTHTHEHSEAAWWRSMEELVPIFEKEGITLHMEPHPEDWCETLYPAMDMLKTIGSKNVQFLYCAPHTFYFGSDMAEMIRDAGSLFAHVHVADTYNHKASSDLRYIINPPGASVTIHQHMDMHQGEIEWDVFFSSLAAVGFDGVVTACVFGWEDRVDSKFAGPSYVLGDLRTHPFYISQVILPHMKIKRLMCVRQSYVKSRAPLEDNAITLMEYANGAIGMVWSSGVNVGSMHGQKVRIVGARASIEWWDERPNQLSYEIQGEPVRILERGMDYLVPEARADDRIGAGHPEGLFEAWANLYQRFAVAITGTIPSRGSAPSSLRYPDIHAGVEGVRWVENCVRSANAGGVWVDYA